MNDSDKKAAEEYAIRKWTEGRQMLSQDKMLEIYIAEIQFSEEDFLSGASHGRKEFAHKLYDFFLSKADLSGNVMARTLVNMCSEELEK